GAYTHIPAASLLRGTIAPPLVTGILKQGKEVFQMSLVVSRTQAQQTRWRSSGEQTKLQLILPCPNR
ncbi:MAG: hypothetical protein QGI45_04595, partial [Myxococcota bacterium]|nr:hypothetical protein [Myxococcota bacterium]